MVESNSDNKNKQVSRSFYATKALKEPREQRRDWKYSSIKNPTTTAGVVGPHDKPSAGDDVNLQREFLV